MEQNGGVAEPAPVAKKERKGNTGLKVLCIVLALTSLALGGFLVFGAINRGEKPQCETVADDHKTETKAEGKSDDKVREIVKKLRSDIMAYLGDTYDIKLYKTVYKVETDFDSYPVFYEFEDGYVTGIDKSYQVSFSSSDYNSNPYISNKTRAADFATNLDKIMVNNGLKKTSTEALEASVMGYMVEDFFAYIDESGNICQVTTGEPLYLSCSNTNWLKEEDKKLAKELIDALKKKEEYAKNDKHVYVGAHASDIKKGKTDDYEIITASIVDAAALFYRKNGGEWVYATATQAPLYCEDFKAGGWEDIFPCENLKY